MSAVDVTDAVSHESEESDHDPDTCESCIAAGLIAEAGAKVLAEAAGVLWDDMNAEHRGHYKVIASEVQAAMSEAMLDLLVARERA